MNECMHAITYHWRLASCFLYLVICELYFHSSSATYSPHSRTCPTSEILNANILASDYNLLFFFNKFLRYNLSTTKFTHSKNTQFSGFLVNLLSCALTHYNSVLEPFHDSKKILCLFFLLILSTLSLSYSHSPCF